jgi:hypothetical protein
VGCGTARPACATRGPTPGTPAGSAVRGEPGSSVRRAQPALGVGPELLHDGRDVGRPRRPHFFPQECSRVIAHRAGCCATSAIAPPLKHSSHHRAPAVFRSTSFVRSLHWTQPACAFREDGHREPRLAGRCLADEGQARLPQIAGRWRAPTGRPRLTLSVRCSSPTTMAVRHFGHAAGDGRRRGMGRAIWDTLSSSTGNPNVVPSRGSGQRARTNHVNP